MGGVERTFDYWLPKGWVQFVVELQAIHPSRGLPVLVMLHGGSDSVAPPAGTVNINYPYFKTVNPEVWVLWDSLADHGTIANPAVPNRWPDVAYIWAWLRDHRKVIA